MSSAPPAVQRLLSRPALLFACVAPLLILKLRFYINAAPLTGWDTIGHARLAAVYRGLFAEGYSLGYDPGWFFGFPAFYFYPPAFYFFTAQLSLVPGISGPLSFHLGILATVLFFAFSYLRVLDLFLPAGIKADPWLASACACLGLTMYLSYAGDGLQGVSLVGVINGTIISTFAHALALTALFHLESYRRAPGKYLHLIQCVLTLSLLFFTHYLTTVFFYILLGLYALANRRRLPWPALGALFLLPPLLAFPVPYNYLRYSYLMNGNATIQHYPALLSLLGSDFFKSLFADGSYFAALLNELVLRFKWLNLGLLAGYLLALRRSFLRRRKQSHMVFLLMASALLLWLSQDASFSYLFHPIGVHWYRVFDLFYGVFVVVAIIGLAGLASRFRRRDVWRARVCAAALCVVAALRFFWWDPLAHENYASAELYASGPDSSALEEFLNGLEPGQLILPEKIRDRRMYGSPHSLDYFIQKYGHRNALGLTVESALTPSVSYAWLASGMPQIFQWGIDPEWNRRLYENAGPQEIQRGLADYLRRAGVDYVLARTPEAFAYLREFFPLAFPESSGDAAAGRNISGGLFVFRVNETQPEFRALATRPVGYLSLNRMRATSARNYRQRRSTTRDFLLHANQLRLRGLLREAPPIINLDPHYPTGEPAALPALTENLSALILMHTGPGLMPSTMSHTLAKTTGLPLILVNFQQTAPDPGPVRYLYTNIQVPERALTASDRRRFFLSDPVNPALAMHPTQFTHNRLQLPVPSVTLPASRPGSSREPAGTTPVVIGLSHFPDWHVAKQPDASDARIYRTDANSMLVFAAPERELRLEFRASFGRTITVLLYLISLALAGIGLVRLLRAR